MDQVQSSSSTLPDRKPPKSAEWLPVRRLNAVPAEKGASASCRRTTRVGSGAAKLESAGLSGCGDWQLRNRRMHDAALA